MRWMTECRNFLFYDLHFCKSQRIKNYWALPKMDHLLHYDVIQKILSGKEMTETNLNSDFIYYHNAPRYFIRSTNFIPFFWNEKDGEKMSVSLKTFKCDKSYFSVINCLINSNLFYLWFVTMSDCRHLNSREILNFKLFEDVSSSDISEFDKLADKLMIDYISNKRRKYTYYKATGNVEYDEYYPKLSKAIIDEIDRVLAEHYGFTEEELDFIINYDIKYRMGDELNAEE